MGADVNLTSALLGAAAPSAGALAAWYAARRKGRADDKSAQATMIATATEAATKVIAALEARVAQLQSRMDQLEQQLEDGRAAWKIERHDLAGRLQVALAALRRAEQDRDDNAGQVRQLQQIVDSLTRRLRELGVDVPLPAARSTKPILLGAPTEA